MNLPTSATPQGYAPYALIPSDALDIVVENDFGIVVVKTYLYVLLHSKSDGTCNLCIDTVARKLNAKRSTIFYALADLDAVDLLIVSGENVIIPDFAAWRMGVEL